MPIDRRISCRSRQLRAHRARLRRRHPNVRVRAGLAPAGGNRHGYAGYEFEPVTSYAFWHVRNRVHNADLGRWTRRDPLQTASGTNLQSYAGATPLIARDPMGLTLRLVSGDFPNGYGDCGTLDCFAKFEYNGPPLGEPHLFVQIVVSTGKCWRCTGEYDSYLFAAYEVFSYVVPANATYFLFPGNDNFRTGPRDHCEAERKKRGVVKLLPASKFTTLAFLPTSTISLAAAGSCCGEPVSTSGQFFERENLPFNPIDFLEADWHNLVEHSSRSAHVCCGCVNFGCNSTTVHECDPGPAPTCPAIPY